MLRARLRQLARELDVRCDDRPRRDALERRVLAGLPAGLDALREELERRAGAERSTTAWLRRPPPELATYRRIADFLLDLAFNEPSRARDVATTLCELADSPNLFVLQLGATALLWLDDRAQLARDDALNSRSTRWRLQWAINVAQQRAGAGALPMLRRCMRLNDNDVVYAALRATTELGARVDMRLVEAFSRRPHHSLRELVRVYRLNNLDERTTAELVELMTSADSRFQQRAREALTLRALGPTDAPPLPRALAPWPGPRPVFADDVTRVAAALWRERPLGWRVPAGLINHASREARKLGRQLSLLNRAFHLEALLRVLKRRPRRRRPSA